MNLDDLQRKLIAAARAHPPTDAVPLGFERRVLGTLKQIVPADYLTCWAHALWRAAAPCVGVALLLIAWSFLGSSNPTVTGSGDLSQDFENTVLAAATVDQTPADALR
jgi:hypothetical protein